MNMRNVEILAPAGSYESLQAAISAGADAIYIGGTRFGARAYANNLDEEQMLNAIDYVHLHGKKIYMTVNTLLKDSEIEELYDYLLPYYKQGLDAVIVQDIGVFRYVKRHFPQMPIHISTQMTVTNELGAELFKELGAERIVPARELSLDEIRKMKNETGLEIECFVHGALCYCYSGQCLLSSMIGGRSGNRGQCAQPCRLPYSIEKGKQQDLLSLKDLCTIEMIPELIEAGIDSFKIEGRMKQPDYVYTVVKMYRKYVDLYLKYGREKYKVSKEDIQILQGTYRRRGYCEGYYKQHNGRNMLSLKRPDALEETEVSLDYKVQEKMNGKLILAEGNNAILFLECGSKQIMCKGDVVQSAVKQPLSTERIDKQMRKTGNTQFIFDKLDIDIQGNVFLPMQCLNEIRRVGITKLEEELLKDYRRDEFISEKIDSEICESARNEAEKLFITASISNLEQLKMALSFDCVERIYVESSIAFDGDVLQEIEKKNSSKEIFIAMPFIFREKSIRKMDGIYSKLVSCYEGALIRNWETYVWFKRRSYEKEMITDYNLYMFNQSAKEMLSDLNLKNHTAPVELHYRELEKLDINDAELIVYGYQPVMISAGCARKNTAQCSGQDGILYLTDRYMKKFAVKNFCKYCYNITYNSSPLMLASQKDEICKLNPKSIRLDFTVESAEMMKIMIELYENVFIKDQCVEMPDIDYTRGHFKRGVK